MVVLIKVSEVNDIKKTENKGEFRCFYRHQKVNTFGLITSQGRKLTNNLNSILITLQNYTNPITFNNKNEKKPASTGWYTTYYYKNNNCVNAEHALFVLE